MIYKRRKKEATYFLLANISMSLQSSKVPLEVIILPHATINDLKLHFQHEIFLNSSLKTLLTIKIIQRITIDSE